MSYLASYRDRIEMYTSAPLKQPSPYYIASNLYMAPIYHKISSRQQTVNACFAKCDKVHGWPHRSGPLASQDPFISWTKGGATLWSDHHETRGGTKKRQMWESWEKKTLVYVGIDAATQLDCSPTGVIWGLVSRRQERVGPLEDVALEKLIAICTCWRRRHGGLCRGAERCAQRGGRNRDGLRGQARGEVVCVGVCCESRG